MITGVTILNTKSIYKPVQKWNWVGFWSCIALISYTTLITFIILWFNLPEENKIMIACLASVFVALGVSVPSLLILPYRTISDGEKICEEHELTIDESASFIELGKIYKTYTFIKEKNIWVARTWPEGENYESN